MGTDQNESRYCLECKSKKNHHFPNVRMDTCKVLYAVWEMQCCGNPIKIGSRVKWPGAKVTAEYRRENIEYKDLVDYHYQAHECKELMSKIQGDVKSITIRYCTFKETNRGMVHDNEKLVASDYVDGWTENKDGEWEAVDYIVDLENVTVREPNKIICIYDLAEELQQ